MAMRSAVKKNKRKSQREAARLQRQAEADLEMEEDEEIQLNQPENTPSTPRVSRSNTPDPETDYTVVLEMVNNVTDKLAALSLDNTNIRAACDYLRRQCHSQGVAFGDLSRLVRQSREDRQCQQDQEETRPYTQEQSRPHPLIRPELIDGRGNLRAEDIGITWQDGDTFLYGVRVAGRREDMEDNRRRPAMSAPYPPGREDIEDTRHRPAMSTPYPPSREHATCRHQDSHVRCALRYLTHPHTNTPHRARRDVLVIDRRHPYSSSTTRPSGGQLGSVTSKR